MPTHANARAELYCKHRSKGMRPSVAATAAGYAPGSSTTHLEQDAEIVARIGELMEELKAHREQQRAAAVEAAKMVGQMTGVGRAWVIQQLAEVAQNAKQDGEYKASIDALELIGKDFGMFSGGSGDDPDKGNVPASLDLDKLSAVLDQAHDALPPPLVDASKVFDDNTAYRLIEGQASPALLREARKLTTGSETDIALTMDDDAGPAEDPAAAIDEPPSEADLLDFDAVRKALED